ncbi:hypothetical protein ABE444_07905 [Brevundimonas pondensis]|uniref:hypothetical protein n=1 Tax=Brevundimonas pondensis TaxID=2774189 RepID=UPI00320BA1AE
MSGISLVQAANDNGLGRPVFVSIPEPDEMQMSVLADIFAGLLVHDLVADNDNAPVRSRRGR